MNTRAFKYFLLFIGLNGLFGNVIGYFLPIYFKEIGFSGVQTGLYFSVSAIATILLSLPMGISSDRLSIVAILMVSFFLMALSKVGFIISHSFGVFCVFALIGSFGGRFSGTAITTMFFKISGAKDGLDNRHQAGLYQLISFIGSGLGMLLGSLLIAGFSFRFMFIFATISNLCFMVLCYFLPRNETVVIKIEDYRRAVFNPRVLFLTFVFFLSSLHWGAEFVSYGPFLKEVLHLSVRQTGLYTGLGFFGVGAGAYFGVILLKKGWIKNLQALLMLGFFMAGLFHILMCVHNAPLSFFFRLLHEVGDGFGFLAFYNGITKVFHIDKIGGCAAFISLWMAIASMSSSILFGLVNDNWGPQWSLIISGAILLMIPFLLMLSGRELMRGNEVST